MSINVLLTLVEQYKEAAQLIEAAQAEQEQLKIQIREALAERSTNYLEVGCHKVRLSDFSSTRLDSKAIKAVAPDLYDQLKYDRIFSVMKSFLPPRSRISDIYEIIFSITFSKSSATATDAALIIVPIFSFLHSIVTGNEKPSSEIYFSVSAI